jgi:hypothetical protein
LQATENGERDPFLGIVVRYPIRSCSRRFVTKSRQKRECILFSSVGVIHGVLLFACLLLCKVLRAKIVGSRTMKRYFSNWKNYLTQTSQYNDKHHFIVRDQFDLECCCCLSGFSDSTLQKKICFSTTYFPRFFVNQCVVLRYCCGRYAVK